MVQQPWVYHGLTATVEAPKQLLPLTYIRWHRLASHIPPLSQTTAAARSCRAGHGPALLVENSRVEPPTTT